MAVGISIIERVAMMITEPTNAPITAAVIPSTKALILWFLAIFLKEGAKSTVNRKQGKNVANAATDAPGKPATR